MYGGEQHTREAKESVGREIDSSQTLEMKHTDHTIGVFSVFFFLLLVLPFGKRFVLQSATLVLGFFTNYRNRIRKNPLPGVVATPAGMRIQHTYVRLVPTSSLLSFHSRT